MKRFRMGSHGFSARALAYLGLLLALGFVVPPARAQGRDQFRAGQQAEEQRNYDEAFEHYQNALQADPNNVEFLMAFRRIRFQAGAMHVDRGTQLQEEGDLNGALAEFERASMIDPSSPIALQAIQEVRALIDQQKSGRAPDQQDSGASLQEALGPPVLEPISRDPINLRMANESRVVYETLGRLAGINVLFDPDFMSRRITVDLSNVTLEEALEQASVLTRSFWKPLSRNTILVLPDTTVKRREQEQQVLKTFYLSNTITPQELTEVVTAIRSLLETRRIQQVNSMNAIIIRDTPDKVAIAEKIIRDVDKAKPEVIVDVAVLEVRRDLSQQIGLFPTSSAGPGIQTTVSPNIGSTSTSTTGTTTGTTTTTAGNTTSLSRIGNLSSGDFSITLPGAQLNALLSDANTKILQRPEIRASDNQRATLRIGDRVPIATGSFNTGVGGAVVSPLVQTQFQYTDVGVNLDITPKVHTNDEITLAVRVELSQVTQQVDIGGIRQPVIGQRIIEHNIRLREGEINVLGGIFQRQNVESVSGIPGLSQVPLLRYIFSNVNTTLAEDEVLIVLRPHAIRRPDINALNLKALDIGTEGDVRLRSPRVLPEKPEDEAAPEVQPEPAEDPGPGAALKLPAQSPTPKLGESFDVPIGIENASDAFSVSLRLAFDPGAMRLVRIAKGEFLGSDGQPVAVVERTEGESGTATVTLSRPPGSGSVSGSGQLAVLTFEALESGSTALGVLPSAILTPARQDLPLQGTQAVLTIQ